MAGALFKPIKGTSLSASDSRKLRGNRQGHVRNHSQTGPNASVGLASGPERVMLGSVRKAGIENDFKYEVFLRQHSHTKERNACRMNRIYRMLKALRRRSNLFFILSMLLILFAF
jgi:hypothetical protein